MFRFNRLDFLCYNRYLKVAWIIGMNLQINAECNPSKNTLNHFSFKYDYSVLYKFSCTTIHIPVLYHVHSNTQSYWFNHPSVSIKFIWTLRSGFLDWREMAVKLRFMVLTCNLYFVAHEWGIEIFSQGWDSKGG